MENLKHYGSGQNKKSIKILNVNILRCTIKYIHIRVLIQNIKLCVGTEERFILLFKTFHDHLPHQHFFKILFLKKVCFIKQKGTKFLFHKFCVH